MAWRPSFTPSGEVLSLFITVPPFLGRPGEHGLRITESGASLPTPLGGPQDFLGSAVFPQPNPAIPAEPPRDPSFFYASAEPLPDGSVLVTGFASSDSQSGSMSDYDIFVQGDDGEGPVLLFGTEENMELDAVALVPAAVPPVIADHVPCLEDAGAPARVVDAIRRNGSFRFVVENLFANAPVDNPAAMAPALSGGLSIEFYMNPQRDGVGSPRPPVMIRRMQVGLDGRIDVTLPAGVPLFEVLRRPASSGNDIALGRDGQVYHVGGMNFGTAGSISVCVGCHAGHSMQEVPADPARMNLAPSAVVTATSTGNPVPGKGTASALIDRSRAWISSEWAASAEDEGPTITLSWPMPVQSDEVEIHAPLMQPGLYGDRTFFNSELLLETYRNGGVVHWGIEFGPILSSTSVRLPDDRPFDEMKITILKAGGVYEGQKSVSAVISEIEVHGQAVTVERPTSTFSRADVDCNGAINVADPMNLLLHMFQGQSLCCQEAGDFNMDGLLNIADVLSTLSFLFLGARPPAQPFPNCATVPESSSGLTCEQATCSD
jgi:hypothetical protein